MVDEALERIVGRAFGLAYCNAPIREGETRQQAEDALVKAAERHTAGEHAETPTDA